jgi:hypothetical protein
MHKKSFSFIFATCSVLAVPLLLHADERTPVYVHPVELSVAESGSNLLSKRFEQSVLEKLQGSMTVRPLSAGSPTGIRLMSEMPASALLKGLVSGRALFENKKLEQASKTLKSAMESFEAQPGASDTFDDYLETLVYLGASYVALGYGGDAKDAFRKLATLTNKIKLDEFADWAGRFDGAVTKKYDKTARKWLKKKPGKLEVSGSKRLQIRIDADDLTTPEQVGAAKLTRGLHRVGCLNDPNQSVKYGWVKIKSRKTVSFDCGELANAADVKRPEINLKKFVMHIKQSPNDGQTVKDGRAIAVALGVKFFVIPFLRTSGEKLEIIGAMFSADSGLTVRIGTFSFGRDIPSVLAQAEVFSQSVEGSVRSFPYQNALVQGFLLKPSSRLTGIGPGALDTRPAPVSKSKTRWYKSWWFWTASAVVVGGLSSAGYYLVEGDEDPDKFELEVTW